MAFLGGQGFVTETATALREAEARHGVSVFAGQLVTLDDYIRAMELAQGQFLPILCREECLEIEHPHVIERGALDLSDQPGQVSLCACVGSR